MDRLSSVVVVAGALVTLAGCTGSESKGEAGASRSRVDAVEAKADEPAVDLAGFCEVYPDAATAPKLQWPTLHGEAATAGDGRPRWLNVWATWCKPCVEELPRLSKWKDSIGARVDYDLVFLSGDGDPEAVTQFSKTHPEVAASLQLEDAAALTPWLQGLGADPPVLPVHVFLDGADRVRCVRTAGIGDADEAAVRQLLTSLQ